MDTLDVNGMLTAFKQPAFVSKLVNVKLRMQHDESFALNVLLVQDLHRIRVSLSQRGNAAFLRQWIKSAGTAFEWLPRKTHELSYSHLFEMPKASLLHILQCTLRLAVRNLATISVIVRESCVLPSAGLPALRLPSSHVPEIANRFEFSEPDVFFATTCSKTSDYCVLWMESVFEHAIRIPPVELAHVVFFPTGCGRLCCYIADFQEVLAYLCGRFGQCVRHICLKQLVFHVDARGVSTLPVDFFNTL